MSSIFPRRFETDRLCFEPLTTETIAPLELYEHTRPGSGFADRMAYLSVDAHDTPNDAREYLEESESAWNESTRANWAMFPRPGEPRDGEFAGVASLIPLWDRRTARLGVWLLKPFWGRGYAGERAAALIEIAFDHLDFELVAAGHLDGNENSKRAIEKYVDRFDGSYDGVIRNCVALNGEVHDLHRYTIPPEGWTANGPPEGIRILDD